LGIKYLYTEPVLIGHPDLIPFGVLDNPIELLWLHSTNE